METKTKIKIKKIISNVCAVVMFLAWSVLCFCCGLGAAQEKKYTASADELQLVERWRINSTITAANFNSYYSSVLGSDVPYDSRIVSENTVTVGSWFPSEYSYEAQWEYVVTSYTAKNTTVGMRPLTYLSYVLYAQSSPLTKRFCLMYSGASYAINTSAVNIRSSSVGGSGYTFYPLGDDYFYLDLYFDSFSENVMLRYNTQSDQDNYKLVSLDSWHTFLSHFGDLVEIRDPLPTPTLTFRNGYLYTEFDSTIADEIQNVVIVGPDKERAAQPGLAIRAWANGDYYAYLTPKSDSDYIDSAHSNTVTVGDVVVLPKLDTPTISNNGAYISWLPIANADYYTVYWGDSSDVMLYSVVTDKPYFSAYESGYYRVSAGSYATGIWAPSDLSNTLDLAVTVEYNPAFKWVIGAADAFLGMHIFGNGFTIGSILGISFGLILLGFAIKIFLGG